MLGISMKKMNKRLDEIRTRFGILESDEQDWKQVCYLRSQIRLTCCSTSGSGLAGLLKEKGLCLNASVKENQPDLE